MPNEFVALDVETANADLASICQIGMVSFDNGSIVDVWKTLVDPEDEFDPMNVSIHGIDEQMAVGAPKIPELAGLLYERLTDRIVASHTAFDRVAVGRAHDRYQLPQVQCTWLDTARVTRRTWPQFSRSGYGLASVAAVCEIDFAHHDAAEDARAAGLILMHAVQKTGLSVAEWVIRSTKPIDPNASSSVARDGNPDGPLAGEVVVFTGTLAITRREAADLAAAAGCDVANSVTKSVTLLVVGDQDVRRLGGHERSSKYRKAENLIREGHGLRILRESDFRALVSF